MNKKQKQLQLDIADQLGENKYYLGYYKKILIGLETWAGRINVEAIILKQNIKSCKVELLEDCIKGKKGTILNRVPNYAIKEIK